MFKAVWIVYLIVPILLLSQISLTVALASANNGEIDGYEHSLLSDVSISRIMAMVERLSGFGTRFAPTKQCEESAFFIYNYLSELKSYESSLHRFSLGFDDCEGINVLALKPGTSLRDEFVLFCAHYDSISWEPHDRAPGANDNAAGVAVLMEVARILDEFTLNRTVLFLFFTAEELGLLGSYAWVSDHQVILNSTVAVICLDGVGRLGATFSHYEGNRMNIMYADEHSEALASLILNASIELGYDRDFITSQSLKGILGSDSGSFTGKGLRVVRLWDRYTEYIHTPFDTPNTLHKELLTKITVLTISVANKLSQEPLDKLFFPLESVDPSTQQTVLNPIHIVVIACSILVVLAFWKLIRILRARYR
jgi:hypothetical protein